jgi:SpoVK/Ycf46/Vps4 family AAA+-type ATPase
MLIGRRDVKYSDKPTISFSLHSLLEHDISFHREFHKSLLHEENTQDADVKSPYKDNREFINEWMQYLRKLTELSWHEYGDRNLNALIDEEPANNMLEAMQHHDRIFTRLEHTEDKPPLYELVDEYKLDENETIILMYLMKEELEGTTADSDELLKLISQDQHEQYLNRKYLSEESKLIRNGLIEETECGWFKCQTGVYRVMPDVVRRIITNTPQNDLERLEHFVQGNELFELKNANQSIEQLILPSELKNTIQTSLQRYNSKTASSIHEWKLFGSDKNIKQTQNLLLLFHGIPGTGKTFAAGAIANALGKQILITDASLIQSCYVGESEKNTRNLFRQFDRICRMMKNPPILLLNEADQLLGKRLDVQRSVDAMHNSVQNLLLEGLENFPGILIAATNHVNNIDRAYSRRFHLKLELPSPGLSERERLWKLHLPESIPGASDIDCVNLAINYQLTGGQIDIIVKNAVTQAASRTGKSKRLTVNDVLQFYELECSTVFGTEGQSIGFSVN